MYGVELRGSDASGGLLGLHQGYHSVVNYAVDYAIDFRIQAWLSESNQAAQVDTFLLGLADYVKDELVSHVDRSIQAR